MNNNKISRIEVNLQSFFKFVLLVFLCMLYAFYEYRILVTALFFPIFLYYFISRRKGLSLFFLWNFLFVGLCAMSLIWSYNSEQTFIEARIMLEIAVISNLLIAFLDSKDKLVSVYKYLVYAGVLYIIRLAFEFPLSSWLAGRLGNDGNFNSNRIGLYLTISALCAFYLAQEKNKKVFYILFPIFGFVIMLTGSRKAFLMLLIGVALLFYLNKVKTISKKVLSIPIVIVILVLGFYLAINVPFLYEILGHRVESMISLLTSSESGLDYSSKIRSEMIETGKALFVDRPFMGYGIGSYSKLSGFGVYSHNNYIELLVGLGIIGTVLYYSIIIYIIIKLFKVRNLIDGNPLLVILLLLMVIDYALVSYNGPLYQYVIALGFATTRIIIPNRHSNG